MKAYLQTQFGTLKSAGYLKEDRGPARRPLIANSALGVVLGNLNAQTSSCCGVAYQIPCEAG